MDPRIAQLLASFEQPMAVLAGCHSRISARLDGLRGLSGDLAAQSGADAQQSASEILRYFDGAGRHHHEDEELDLLPRLRQAAAGDHARRVLAIAGNIEREHADMERQWMRLRDALEDLAHGAPRGPDPAAVGRFCSTYAIHMQLEEASLFPLASVLLTADDLVRLGRDMARRRGLG